MLKKKYEIKQILYHINDVPCSHCWAYYNSPCLKDLFEKISRKEVYKFNETVIKKFNSTEQDSRKNEKIGLIVCYNNEKRKSENKNYNKKIKGLEHYLEICWSSEYPALLIYIKDHHTKMTWELEEKPLKRIIKENMLFYFGKNFGEAEPRLIETWKSILTEYFQFLEKYEKTILSFGNF
ncbi:MAG: hypothetical protein QXW65_01650 [Candidatus Pacearchaeota archaeon]